MVMGVGLSEKVWGECKKRSGVVMTQVLLKSPLEWKGINVQKYIRDGGNV